MKKQLKFFWVQLTGTEAFPVIESIFKDNPLMKMVYLPPDIEIFSKILQSMPSGACQLPVISLPGLKEYPSQKHDIMTAFKAYNQFVAVYQKIYSTACKMNWQRVQVLPVMVLSTPLIAQAAHYVALSGFVPPDDKMVFPSITSPYVIYQNNEGRFTIWDNVI